MIKIGLPTLGGQTWLALGGLVGAAALCGAIVLHLEHQGAAKQALKDAPAITQGIVNGGAAQLATATTQQVTGREAHEARITQHQQQHVEAVEGAPDDRAAYAAYLDWLHDRPGAAPAKDVRGVSGGPCPSESPECAEGPR